MKMTVLPPIEVKWILWSKVDPWGRVEDRCVCVGGGGGGGGGGQE